MRPLEMAVLVHLSRRIREGATTIELAPNLGELEREGLIVFYPDTKLWRLSLQGAGVLLDAVDSPDRVEV